ncbi:hypothetical protein EGW08_020529, partial [Elysia chlorotica]
EMRAASVAASLTLAALGSAGNALSIGLICSGGGLGRAAPTMALILGMCSANLVSTALLLPVIAASNLSGAWLFGGALCRVFGYVVYVTLTGESLTLLALTLAQYLTVVHRVTAGTLRRRLPALVAGPWLAAGLIFLAPLTGVWETFAYDPRRGYCTLVSASRLGGAGGMFLILVSTILGTLMTLVIVYCYSAILYVTHRAAPPRVTWGLPSLPFLGLVAADPCLERVSPQFVTAILYVSWSHAATNPIIYALSNTRINRLWTELCCRYCRRLRRGRAEDSVG